MHEDTRSRKRWNREYRENCGSLIIAISHTNALKLNGNGGKCQRHKYPHTYTHSHRQHNVYEWWKRDYLTYDDGVSPIRQRALVGIRSMDRYISFHLFFLS